jgi:hypothetical protein
MKSLSPLCNNGLKLKTNIYDLKSTGLNLIPEEDEEKLKTMYSSKKFFDNNIENILRLTKKEFRPAEKEIPLTKCDKPTKFKINRSIRLKSPTNASSDFASQVDTITPKVENKVIKKSISATEKSLNKFTNNVFTYPKQVTTSINHDNSATLNCFFEEDSTKLNSTKTTPDHTRFTPNSIKSERSNSRSLKKYTTPPDSAKLPSIYSTRGKKDYDINNIMSVANDFKEDPVIKKKLNDIYQNIADIQKVLDQRIQNRIKISSAPVGLEDNEFAVVDMRAENREKEGKRMIYNQLKLRLPNSGIVGRILDKDKFPIKVVKK